MKRVDVASVLLFDESGEKVLMVKNKGEGDSYYTLPGGAVETGETLDQAAIREVKEEAGLDVKVEGLFSVSEAFFEKRDHHAVFFTFLGKIVGGEIGIAYPDEIEEVTWMSVQSAEKHMLIEGLIERKNSVPYRMLGSRH